MAQYLPPPQRAQTSPPVYYGAFDGQQAEHRYGAVPPLLPSTPNQWTVNLGLEQGEYDSQLRCRSGAANIDNVCVCPGSLNSAPWESDAPVLTEALMQDGFVPYVRDQQLLPGTVARHLMDARGPFPASYAPMNYPQ